MRLVAVIAITALIALVTAFDYQASDLFLTPADAAPDQPVTDQPATDQEATGQASAIPSAENPTAGEDTPDIDEMFGAGTDSVSLTSIGMFAAPIDVIARSGDDRIFVVELMGTITAAAVQGETTADVVLDVSALTLVEGEHGLLGAAFHPEQDLLYVHYSNLDGTSVIAEYNIDATTAVADPASARTVLTVEQPYANHNGGEVEFGPDGYLYLGFGDGGLADDPIRSALDLTSPLGKILRIDPTPTATNSYTTPADNPFVDVEDADPTIWSYGLRNPWKFSFDAATGDLWIADVGQNQWEEINAAPAVDGADAGRGLSFGWSAFEGTARFNDDQPGDGHTDPFVSYERDEGRCSISGGAVYRGSEIPELNGWYLYGDYCTGQIFGFDTSLDDDDREIVQLAQLDALVAISTGADGELYASSVAGSVVRLG